jgi:hypothetical protein
MVAQGGRRLMDVGQKRRVAHAHKQLLMIVWPLKELLACGY